MCLRSNTKGVEISGIDSGKLGTLYSAARQQEKEWNFGAEKKKSEKRSNNNNNNKSDKSIRVCVSKGRLKQGVKWGTRGEIAAFSQYLGKAVIGCYGMGCGRSGYNGRVDAIAIDTILTCTP